MKKLFLAEVAFRDQVPFLQCQSGAAVCRCHDFCVCNRVTMGFRNGRSHWPKPSHRIYGYRIFLGRLDAWQHRQQTCAARNGTSFSSERARGLLANGPAWAKSHCPTPGAGSPDSPPEICCLPERLGKFRHRPQLTRQRRAEWPLQHRSRNCSATRKRCRGGRTTSGPASYQRRLNDLFTLRAAGFGPGFAPKNPRLGHLQVIRVCTN